MTPMKIYFKPWLVLRIALLAPMVGFTDIHDPNLTWTIAVSFAVGAAILTFIWLISMAYDQNVDWSDPYSLTKPFFPLTRYPVRFWLLLSAMAILNGIVSSARDLFLHGNISPDSGMFLLPGLSILAGLVLFWLSPANSHNRKGSKL